MSYSWMRWNTLPHVKPTGAYKSGHKISLSDQYDDKSWIVSAPNTSCKGNVSMMTVRWLIPGTIACDDTSKIVDIQNLKQVTTYRYTKGIFKQDSKLQHFFKRLAVQEDPTRFITLYIISYPCNLILLFFLKTISLQTIDILDRYLMFKITYLTPETERDTAVPPVVSPPGSRPTVTTRSLQSPGKHALPLKLLFHASKSAVRASMKVGSWAWL